MSNRNSLSPRIITRRDFLQHSVTALSGAALFSSPAAARPQELAGSINTDLSSVIAMITQTLPVIMRRKDILGASVALIDAKKIVWVEGFGHTDRSLNLKVTPDTPFFVGSISKSFTTLGILKAVGKGILSLDHPLKNYLPWFTLKSRFGTAEVDKITIRHLLSHHSGLGTWALLGNPYDSQYHTRTFEEVVKSTRDSWLKFPAGERFEYCNQGIDLAGYALQVAVGKPFAEYMREEILAPLGMTASTFAQREVTDKAPFAVPYQGTRAVPIRNGIIHPMLAAGGLMSSARDMGRFVAFHLQDGKVNGKRLIPANLLQEMYAPQFTARDLLGGYGLGVYKAFQYNAVRLSHGGSGYGISAHYRWLPEYKLGVVVLTNQGAVHNAPEIASEVVKLLLKAKLGSFPQNKLLTPTNAPRASVDESALRRLEGTYLLYEGVLFRFKSENGQLFHLDGKEKLQLEAHSPTEFTSGTRRYYFVLDETGKPRGVRVFDPYYDPSSMENGVTYLPINDTPADERGANKREWAQHVGKYIGTFTGESTEVRISLRDGYLYLNNELKLTEQTSGLFFTVDGEAAVFKNGSLLSGNKFYLKKK
jgi:CubicO group peptidase (beta-lactamase class C family)